MRSETGARVVCCDAELHVVVVVVCDNVEDVPLLLERAETAWTVAVTQGGRARRAVVAFAATNTVRRVGTEPLRLQQRCSQLVEAVSEGARRFTWIIAGADSTDTPANANPLGPWCCIVPIRATNAVRAPGAAPLVLNESAALSFYLTSERLPQRGGVTADAC
jgi:hypothetical protein